MTPAGAFAARAAGGVALDASVGIWRLPDRRAVERLRRAGLIRLAEAERRLLPLASPAFSDPLVDREWWLQAVDALDVDPPGPGRPVSIVDSGLIADHPEFAGRPNVTVMNEQPGSTMDADHGTEVASVVGAPTNGVGIVGVYPQAVLRMWDASPDERITNGDAIAGIADAAASGPGVISLSWGSRNPDPLLRRAVLGAVRAGSLVVAASGNERQLGAPAIYPASFPHVLTVGATDESGRIAGFSSASPGMDVVAPGVDIPVADPTSSTGYSLADGTSFSAPIVAGAAAWIWTKQPTLTAAQVAALLEATAHDLGPPGWDRDTGAGLIDVAAALAAPMPPADPSEPNDDIAYVRPSGFFTAAVPPLTPGTTLTASLDGVDDPRDVYRVAVPAGRTLRAVVGAADGAPLAVSLWRTGTRSVAETGAVRRRDLLRAGAGAVTARGVTYVAVGGSSTRRTSYTLTLATVARR